MDGGEKLSQGHGGPINMAYSRSFQGVQLWFKGLFQVPAGMTLEAPKDFPTTMSEDRSSLSLERDSAKAIMPNLLGQ